MENIGFMIFISISIIFVLDNGKIILDHIIIFMSKQMNLVDFMDKCQYVIYTFSFCVDALWNMLLYAKDPILIYYHLQHYADKNYISNFILLFRWFMAGTHHYPFKVTASGPSNTCCVPYGRSISHHFIYISVNLLWLGSAVAPYTRLQMWTNLSTGRKGNGKAYIMADVLRTSYRAYMYKLLAVAQAIRFSDGIKLTSDLIRLCSCMLLKTVWCMEINLHEETITCSIPVNDEGYVMNAQKPLLNQAQLRGQHESLSMS
ncbi:hypothetical protein ACJX0J_027131, partial [Zea mays]